MKHIAICLAVLGLAVSGCAQNQVFGPMARKGADNLKMALTKKSNQKKNIRSELDAVGMSDSEIQLTAFGKKNKNDCCCGDSCCCGDDCCCGDGSCCGDDCCSSGNCKSGGGMRDRCRRMCGLNPHAGGYPEAQNFTPSPPSGQVAYPYYTTRGPRDFLLNNPPTIGPY